MSATNKITSERVYLQLNCAAADFAKSYYWPTELEITAGHHYGWETFQSIFSQIGWKYFEKSLLHSDDRPLFRAMGPYIMVYFYV